MGGAYLRVGGEGEVALALQKYPSLQRLAGVSSPCTSQAYFGKHPGDVGVLK